MPQIVRLLSATISFFCLLTTGSVLSQEPVAPATDPLHGTQIAVTIHTPDRKGIFVVDSAGKQPRQLTSDEMDHSPAWSPDGGRIAFLSVRQGDFEDAAQHDLAGHWFLYVIEADGARQRRVSSMSMTSFRWSPDGEHFLFVSSFEDPRNRGLDGTVSSAIYIMDANGANVKRLTRIAGHDSDPAWSADGKRIAFSSGRGAEAGIYLTAVDGGEVRRVVETSGTDEFPVWSPDSTRLAFASRRGRPDEQSSIIVAAVDGIETKCLADGFGANALPLDWSPDGKWLLVYGGGRLHVVLLEEGKRVRLTGEGNYAPEGIFLRGGDHVLYREHRNDEWKLVVGSIEGNRQQIVVGGAITFSARSTEEKTVRSDEM